MKKRLAVYIMLAVFLTTAVFPVCASAGIDDQLKEDCAAFLADLKIMQGDNSGNLLLDNDVTRTEFVTLVTRLIGWDRDTELEDIGLEFSDSSDIPSWAVNYIKTALKYELIKGYNTGDSVQLRPNNTVTTAEAAMILVRALGYESAIQGGWPDGVMDTASTIGLFNNIFLPSDHKLTRGETAVIIYNSLTVEYRR